MEFFQLNQQKPDNFKSELCQTIEKDNLSKPMKWEPIEVLLIMNQLHP